MDAASDLELAFAASAVSDLRRPVVLVEVDGIFDVEVGAAADHQELVTPCGHARDGLCEVIEEDDVRVYVADGSACCQLLGLGEQVADQGCTPFVALHGRNM